jgi:hypothetical protein
MSFLERNRGLKKKYALNESSCRPKFNQDLVKRNKFKEAAEKSQVVKVIIIKLL